MFEQIHEILCHVDQNRFGVDFSVLKQHQSDRAILTSICIGFRFHLIGGICVMRVSVRC